jgi:hypothetical protein
MWKRCKKTQNKEQGKNPKTQKTHKLSKKGFCGVGWSERQSDIYIASVGPQSGRYIDVVRTRAASERSRLVTRVRTINFNCPPDTGSVRLDVKQLLSERLSSISVRTSGNYLPDAPHWNIRKIEENSQKSNFSQVSFRTRMYKPLITQSESISILNRDIKESWEINKHK